MSLSYDTFKPLIQEHLKSYQGSRVFDWDDQNCTLIAQRSEREPITRIFLFAISGMPAWNRMTAILRAHDDGRNILLPMAVEVFHITDQYGIRRLAKDTLTINNPIPQPLLDKPWHIQTTQPPGIPAKFSRTIIRSEPRDPDSYVQCILEDCFQIHLLRQSSKSNQPLDETLFQNLLRLNRDCLSPEGVFAKLGKGKCNGLPTAVNDHYNFLQTFELNETRPLERSILDPLKNLVKKRPEQHKDRALKVTQYYQFVRDCLSITSYCQYLSQLLLQRQNDREEKWIRRHQAQLISSGLLLLREGHGALNHSRGVNQMICLADQEQPLTGEELLQRLQAIVLSRPQVQDSRTQETKDLHSAILQASALEEVIDYLQDPSKTYSSQEISL